MQHPDGRPQGASQVHVLALHVRTVERPLRAHDVGDVIRPVPDAGGGFGHAVALVGKVFGERQ